MCRRHKKGEINISKVENNCLSGLLNFIEENGKIEKNIFVKFDIGIFLQKIEFDIIERLSWLS